jgi:nucleoside-diphosphate-sugar epimerase
MLEHLNPAPQKPSRVVVLGAYGFVGGTCARLLAARGVPVASGHPGRRFELAHQQLAERGFQRAGRFQERLPRHHNGSAQR